MPFSHFGGSYRRNLNFPQVVTVVLFQQVVRFSDHYSLRNPTLGDTHNDLEIYQSVDRFIEQSFGSVWFYHWV